jgi:hypothetical protein
MSRSTPLRAKIVAFSLSIGIAALGVPALAQEATPVGTPVGGPVTEMPPTPEWAEVVATGLANPRGMAFGSDRALYVAESGIGGGGPCRIGPEGNEECFGESGGVTRIADGGQERVLDGLASFAAEGGMNASGPNDVSLVGDTLYVLIGFAGDPVTRVDAGAGEGQFGRLFRTEGDGIAPVVDVAAYETANNPDTMALDSNPFTLEMQPDGTGAIVDAGMNTLLSVDASGQLSTLSVFPNETATAPDGSEIPMNPVPTGLATAPDGSYYVGQLTGFPFPPGGAKVFGVAGGGSEPLIAYEGFTNIIDVALAPDGSLYVLEFSRGGMLSIDPANPATLEGQLTRIAPDGTREVVANEGLVAPTGLAIAADGSPHVAVFGVVGNMGQVWRIAPAA